jgi:hypothetical protein
MNDLSGLIAFCAVAGGMSALVAAWSAGRLLSAERRHLRDVSDAVERRRRGTGPVAVTFEGPEGQVTRLGWFEADSVYRWDPVRLTAWSATAVDEGGRRFEIEPGAEVLVMELPGAQQVVTGRTPARMDLEIPSRTRAWLFALDGSGRDPGNPVRVGPGGLVELGGNPDDLRLEVPAGHRPRWMAWTAALLAILGAPWAALAWKPLAVPAVGLTLLACLAATGSVVLFDPGALVPQHGRTAPWVRGFFRSPPLPQRHVVRPVIRGHFGSD